MKQILSSFVCGGLLLLPLHTLAASCCGGGAASSLILPKGARYMLDAGVSRTDYTGSWSLSGYHREEPDGNHLLQYRTNLGLAYRLANRWQASVQLPYVWNDSEYPSQNYQSSNWGDSTLGLTYETFDDIKCVWKVTNWKSLVPAIYIGSTITLPTGKSIYNYSLEDSTEATGLGFYRWDTNLLIDKTIYPWTMVYSFSYGKYLERSVNAEPGQYVEPYDLKRGNRLASSLSLGYTIFLESQGSIVITSAFNHLEEKDSTRDGKKDDLPGFKKQSLSLSASYSAPAMDWIYKLSLNHDLSGHGRGANFPTTDVISLGVSYVIR